jgi:hypothetical protein
MRSANYFLLRMSFKVADHLPATLLNNLFTLLDLAAESGFIAVSDCSNLLTTFLVLTSALPILRRTRACFVSACNVDCIRAIVIELYCGRVSEDNRRNEIFEPSYLSIA